MNTGSMAILILLGGFFPMVFLCFPIAYVVALSPVFCLLFQGHDPTAICQQMVKGTSSFNPMIVPLFIIIGCLMGSGGISEKLIALVNACIGWIRSDMVMINIVVSYFFGGISGSVSTDTASLGSILVPMMVDQGHDDDFSTAVTIILSCKGLLTPSSHNMVIYATVAGGIPVGNFFLARYIPGVLLTVMLIIGPCIISVKRNHPKGKKFSIINLVKQLGISFWTLTTVLIVIFGMVGGAFTATESAAITVICSLIINIFIYKGLDWKRVWRMLGNSVDVLPIVMILTAASNIFGFCLTQLHVLILAAGVTTGMTNNPILLALLLNLILLVLGCIVNVAPTILTATPVLFPIATSINLDPIQFGIVVVLNCSIGPLIPPTGAVLFTDSMVSRVPIERVIKAMLPFHVCMIITLLLITFTPAIGVRLPFVLAH